MDHAMVDLTDVPQAAEGDEVVLIGDQGGDAITAEAFARWAGTISYEILSRLGSRVPRLFVPDCSGRGG
jgi:alanine racemase